MICKHYVIMSKDKETFLTDIFGDVLHFDSVERAEEYIKELELENVEIIPQF